VALKLWEVTSQLAFKFRAAEPLAGTVPEPQPPIGGVPDLQQFGPHPLFSKHVQGRRMLAFMFKCVYFISLVTVTFASYVVISQIGIMGLGIGLLVCTVLGISVVATDLWIPPMSVGWVMQLFQQADAFDVLKVLVPEGGTGEAVNVLFRLTLFCAVVPFMISLALFSWSIRPSEESLTAELLKRRKELLHIFLFLSSTLLVLAVLVAKVLHDWALTLIHSTQAAAMRPMADITVFDTAAGNSLLLLSVFTPAVLAYVLDVRCYRRRMAIHLPPARTDRAGSATTVQDDELSLAPSSKIAGIVAIAAPVLTPVIGELLKFMARATGYSASRA
jgi:hypothetical protein